MVQYWILDDRRRPLHVPKLSLLLLLSQLRCIVAVSSSVSSPSSIAKAPSRAASTVDALSRPTPNKNPTVEEEKGDATKQTPKQNQRFVMTSVSTESESIISSKATFPSNNHIVFSDVDGTLVHYPARVQSNDGVNGGSTKESTSSSCTLLPLPPSKTGSRGFISSKTLLLCHRLRHGIFIMGDEENDTFRTKVDESDIADDITKDSVENDVPVVIPLVLISGMRTSTLFKRLPFLPRSDAYVCESGGRIFYPRPFINANEINSIAENGYVNGLVVRPILYPGMPSGHDKPFILEEDMYWRELISQPDAAGSDGYDNYIQIEQRRGKLWDFARTLIANDNDKTHNDCNAKYTIDADGYATAFRIRYSQNTTGEGSNDISSSPTSSLPPLPYGLACSTNLGCVDIYPAMSGKRNCAEYLARKFIRDNGETNEAEPRSFSSNNGERGGSILKTNAYCLCDDDNDIEMALACRAAYLPSVTSETIRALASSEKNSFIVAKDERNGIVESLATEAALHALLEELQSLRK